MTATKKTSTPTVPQRKPLSAYADAEVSPIIQEFCEWLAATGVEIDPMSVYLGSALRARFQEERREAKKAAEAKPARKRTPKATQETNR